MNLNQLLTGMTKDALHTVHTELSQTETPLSALELFIWLDRLEKWAGVMKGRLKPEANAEFEALRAAQPEAKGWQPLPFATLRSQSNKTSYSYPMDVTELEAKLAAAKETAKATKTATKRVSPLDPAADQLFKVSLNLC